MRRLLVVPLFLLLLTLSARPGQAQSDLADEYARYFPTTGQWVGGVWLAKWKAAHGPTTLGDPRTVTVDAVSLADGRVYHVQYFERAILELHPDRHGTPDHVQLVPLTTYPTPDTLAQTRQAGPSSPPSASPPTATVAVAGCTPLYPVGERHTCGDFKTQADAQCYYEASGGATGTAANLDGTDKDGKVCESLP